MNDISEDSMYNLVRDANTLKVVLLGSSATFVSVLNQIPTFEASLPQAESSYSQGKLDSFNLNPQQQEFLDVISALECSFYYIFSGTAGSGKSYTLAALQAKMGSSIMFLASTGKAAAHLPMKCNTVHSMFPCRSNDIKDPTERVKRVIRDQFYGVRVIVIEEYSMIRACLLAKVNFFLRKSFSKDETPFAGISVILTVAIQQLLPVMAKPLWTPIKNSDSPLEKRGKQLFKLFVRNFNLTEVMRQSGDDQLRFRDLLENIGQGVITRKDFGFLESRFLKPQTHSISRELISLCPTKFVRFFRTPLD